MKPIPHEQDIGPELDQNLKKSGVPKGIRTPVTAVKGRCPRPLDDGDLKDFCDGQRPVWWR
jgi:hypothetical protein